ncbi:MAG: hypothetical protein ACLQGP_03790 [Isosphaeraceae bacterium]
MIVTNYTPEDLKKLPLRAIVALAARFARRVEPQTALPVGHPLKERCRAAVANAIGLAEDFARGSACTSLESAGREVEACRALAEGDFVCDSALGAVVLAARAANAAIHALELRDEPEEPHPFGPAKPNPFPHLADVSADLVARDVFVAALEANGAIRHVDTFINRSVEDYEKLLQLELGSYPQAGQPIDPSSKGPLGPL